MTSYVKDLLDSIFKDDDIISLLRRALIIADELGSDSFKDWINWELGGYFENLDDIPSYRIFECELNCSITNGFNTRHYVPVGCLPDDLLRELKIVFIKESISEIIDMCNTDLNVAHVNLDSAIENSIRNIIKMNDDSITVIEIYRVCPIHHLNEIINQVKNNLLDWCLQLKNNGILGEEYNFTENEINSAKQINQYFFNNSQIQFGINNIQTFNQISFKSEISSKIENMTNVLNQYDVSNEVSSVINNNIEIIKKELEKENSNLPIIENAVNLIKNFAKEITISYVANLLIQNSDAILAIISSWIH